MKLNELQEKYPIHNTLIGFYSTDQIFTANSVEQVKDIAEWRENPLYKEPTYMPFIRYQDGRFECWGFDFSRVCGYFTDGLSINNNKLVTYEDEFGYELTDPENDLDEFHIIITPDSYDYEAYNYDWDKITSFDVMNEHAARVFDENAYFEGRIFTSPEQLINFVKKMEENS